MLHIVSVTKRRVTDYVTHRPCYKPSCYRLSMLHIVSVTNRRVTNYVTHRPCYNPSCYRLSYTSSLLQNLVLQTVYVTYRPITSHLCPKKHPWDKCPWHKPSLAQIHTRKMILTTKARARDRRGRLYDQSCALSLHRPVIKRALLSHAC